VLIEEDIRSVGEGYIRALKREVKKRGATSLIVDRKNERRIKL
jgi:hypothetical protein